MVVLTHTSWKDRAAPPRDSSFPDNENLGEDPPLDSMEDFPGYLSDTVDMLNGQPPNAFSQDLNQLDAMIGSIERSNKEAAWTVSKSTLFPYLCKYIMRLW